MAVGQGQSPVDCSEQHHLCPTQARILFVSESNVCRSVLAEAIMRDLLDAAGMADHVTVASAGSRDYNVGDGPDPLLVEVAQELQLRCASVPPWAGAAPTPARWGRNRTLAWAAGGGRAEAGSSGARQLCLARAAATDAKCRAQHMLGQGSSASMRLDASALKRADVGWLGDRMYCTARLPVASVNEWESQRNVTGVFARSRVAKDCRN